jgi:hypothetical protein
MLDPTGSDKQLDGAVLFNIGNINETWLVCHGSLVARPDAAPGIGRTVLEKEESDLQCGKRLHGYGSGKQDSKGQGYLACLGSNRQGKCHMLSAGRYGEAFLFLTQRGGARLGI